MSTFPLPLVFASWGTAPDGEYENSIGRLRDHALSAKIKTVAVQASKVRPDQVAALKEKGLFVVAWDEASRITKDSFDKLGVNGYMPQVEGDGQFASAVASLKAGVGAGLPKAVVTTYGGMYEANNPRSGSRWQALVALGVTSALVECYASDDPVHADLDRMLGQGTVYGITAAALIPVCGVFRGELPPAYGGLSNKGREFGIYLAEPMSDAQWKAWGGVNLVTQVYYWRLVAGASLLHEERAIIYADGATGLGKMLDWMDAHKDTIRAAGHVDLQRVLADPH